MRKILLLGAGRDVYRRYLLESITREYEVVLAQATSTPWADDLVHASHAIAPDDVEPAATIGRCALGLLVIAVTFTTTGARGRRRRAPAVARADALPGRSGA
jgi:hypothetical protein